MTTTEGRRFRRPERVWQTVFILFCGLFNPALFLVLRFDLPITLLPWGNSDPALLMIFPSALMAATAAANVRRNGSPIVSAMQGFSFALIATLPVCAFILGLRETMTAMDSVWQIALLPLFWGTHLLLLLPVALLWGAMIGVPATILCAVALWVTTTPERNRKS